MDKHELTGLTDSQWRWYITGILEGMAGDIKETKTKQDTCNEKIGKLDKRTATIGGTIALAVSILVTLLGTFFKHLMGGN